MEINLMPVVNIRPKGQVTIPAEILQAWQIHSNDKINVSLVNGVVMLTPVNRRGQKNQLCPMQVLHVVYGAIPRMLLTTLYVMKGIHGKNSRYTR
jgi:AbrB family looped-hinge helix DNA binding protein